MTTEPPYKPERDPDLSAIEYWNHHGLWSETLPQKNVFYSNEATILNSDKKECIKLFTTELKVLLENPFRLPIGKTISKFAALARLKFKGNQRAAVQWIEYKYLNKDIPYIRVGSDYFKIIYKTDRYKVKRLELKGWKKEEVKQDVGASTLNHIQTYDDFIVVPNNTDHQQVVDNCYNLYHPFSHTIAESCSIEEIPTSIKMMKHIFGNQFALGMQYMNYLYQVPTQPLPILCLVSKERHTGKTSFMNWLQVIFGFNFCMINPEDLSSSFNSVYASKNIIALDETVIDKSHAIEKLKSLATAKTITVNQKFVSNYSIPFFGKIIISTNKETDFMRIDSEEIRFWVRKVPKVGDFDSDFEKKLIQEIPLFLRYLQNIELMQSKSRMIFSKEDIDNDYLKAVVVESKSSMFKELQEYITEWFANCDQDELYATPLDIKKEFFPYKSDANAHYISKVLKEEFNCQPLKIQRYYPFNKGGEFITERKSGAPYLFLRSDFIGEAEPELRLTGTSDPF